MSADRALIPAHPEEALAALLRGRPDGEAISRRVVPPQDADTVAYVTVRWHANGTLSTQGHILDKEMAIQLLEQGIAAIRGSAKVPERGAIVVPSRDVEVTPDPAIPLKEYGDLLPHERGDG